MALFHHVAEHHRDLRDRTADVDETEKEKIEKHFAPRRHLTVCVGLVLLIVAHRRCRNSYSASKHSKPRRKISLSGRPSFAQPLSTRSIPTASTRWNFSSSRSAS